MKIGEESPVPVEASCPGRWAGALGTQPGRQAVFRGQDGSGLHAVKLHQVAASGNEVPLLSGLI